MCRSTANRALDRLDAARGFDWSGSSILPTSQIASTAYTEGLNMGHIWWILGTIAVIYFLGQARYEHQAPAPTFEQWQSEQRVLDRIEQEHGGVFLRTPPPPQ
jgi:hypothetical protein